MVNEADVLAELSAINNDFDSILGVEKEVIKEPVVNQLTESVLPLPEKTEELQEPEIFKELFDASILINISDIIVARLFAVGAVYAGYDASYTDFKLDANEKRQLQPIAEAWMKRYNWSELSLEAKTVIVLLSIYGFKIHEVMEKPRIKAVKKESAKKEVAIEGVVTQDGRPYHPDTHLKNGKPRVKPLK